VKRWMMGRHHYTLLSHAPNGQAKQRAPVRLAATGEVSLGDHFSANWIAWLAPSHFCGWLHKRRETQAIE